MGYSQEDQSQWSLPLPIPEGRVFHPGEGPVQMTPFPTSQTQSGSIYENAAHHGIPQLVSGRIQRRDWDHDVLPEHTLSYQGGPHLDSHLHRELRAVKEENAWLLQSGWVFQSGVRELNKARSELPN